jgi:hypothetical protein
MSGLRGLLGGILFGFGLEVLFRLIGLFIQ